jgi:REP element-mobilizing transposase RayT
MTQARKQIVSLEHAGTYHCVSRCVRRSWLCGFDHYLQKSFEHRKPWVERRIVELSEIFACSVLAYAVMSNHFHLVVSMQPAVAQAWSATEVAQRWGRLFPRKNAKDELARMEHIAANEVLVAKYRGYLQDLSWLMKMIAEPIARRANAEDQTTGRFWQGRFKCQLLQSERSILAAMTYVDLNPIRAQIADSTATSKHTSIRQRGKAIRGDLKAAQQALKPLLGCSRVHLPTLTEGEYLELVDFTGRQISPGKRGWIKQSEPKALDKLGLNPDHWAHRVKGFGEGFGARWFRVVGELEEMLEKARAIQQRTLFGTGLARLLNQA